MRTYTLPDLPYDHAALEPHVDARIMELHHGAHHASYVAKANAAVEALEAARDAGDHSAITKLTTDLAFNLSGHVLHSIFWRCMHPDGGGDPEGDLAAAIDESFGGPDALRSQLGAATTTVQGSGWGVLAWEPLGERLIVQQVHDHQADLVTAAEPIVVIDGWEHAYYLQYRNDKASWVDAFWSVVDWRAAAERFAARDRTAAMVEGRR